eukprot:3562513-Alexandrium_andersonii.AAC.1
MSPLVACQRHLAELLSEGVEPGSALAPLATHFCGGSRQATAELMSTVRRVAIDIGSQMMWRFLPLHNLPASLVRCAASTTSTVAAREMWKSVFELPPCCRDADCTEKIVR